MLENLEEYLNTSFSLSKLETTKVICSNCCFQDNILCMDVSGALSPWKAGLVLLLGNVSVGEYLEACWSVSLMFSSLIHTYGETERDDKKQLSAIILETPLICDY